MLKRTSYFIVGVALIAMPFLVGITPVTMWRDYRASAGWPKVQATVDTVEECFGASSQHCRAISPLAPRHREEDPIVRISYSYQYNGRTYSGHHEDVSSSYWRRLREPPRRGAKLEVLVNPQRPEHTARSQEEVLIQGVLALLAPLLGALFIYLAITGRTDEPDDPD